MGKMNIYDIAKKSKRFTGNRIACAEWKPERGEKNEKNGYSRS